MKIFVFSTILILLFDFRVQIQAQSKSDSVKVTIQLELPENTPEDANFYLAGTINGFDPGIGFGWKNQSIPFNYKNGRWEISLTRAKGDTITYKITRGTIYSAEESVDYTYRAPRELIFDKDKTVTASVEAWHDIPPENMKDLWPEINLEPVKDKVFKYNDRVYDWMGTILYADDIVRYYYGDQIRGTLQEIEPSFSDTTIYYQVTSKAPDNTLLVVAGKSESENPWMVYIDQNNDNKISNEEYVFSENDSSTKWEGLIHYDKIRKNRVINDTTQARINLVTDLPQGYSSSNRKDVPDLVYSFPNVQRKATIVNKNDTLNVYMLNFFEYLFTENLQVFLDVDGDDVLQMGSGTNEDFSVNANDIRRAEKYYFYPHFEAGNQMYEIADIDPHGNWVRLRPSFEESQKQLAAIEVGVSLPDWDGTTLDEKPISKENLTGKYVLLDFWGSWCGPCIEELPYLKQAYDDFKNSNFEIVGLAYDSIESTKEAISKYDIKWPQVMDDGEFSTLFRIQGYPFQILVNPEGNIIETGQALRGEKLEQTLMKYLN
ncbi:TlpA family protein disulfide reductase [Gracilimonas halophila]|uniref:TlpA family protein disulfide reductase n=1 Tax=Gracilimonas halophila TaxID=1834464 RepID=A0ABW5JMY7_9BACT